MATPQDLSTRYRDILSASRTAYDPGVAPTEADLDAERRARAAELDVEVQKGEELRQKWYGDEEDDDRDVKERPGLIGGALKVLGAPLYGSVGAIESVLGRGTKPGMWENIKANVQEEGTYGDLLRGYNIPNYLSMPLGFALDVGLDPVNVGTLGATGLFGGIASGARAAGTAGAKQALRSSALKKAYRAVELLPGAKSEADEGIALMARKLGKRAEQADIDFYETIGGERRIVDPYLTRRAMDRMGLKAAREGWDKIPENDWRKLGFEYSPSKRFHEQVREIEEAMLPGMSETDDPLLRAAIKQNAERRTLPDTPLSSAEWSDMVARRPELKEARDTLEWIYQLGGETDSALRLSDEMIARKEISALLRTLDQGDMKNLKRFNMLKGKDEKHLRNYVRQFKDLRSGMKAADQAAAKMLLDGNLAKTVSAYRGMIDVFKTTKLGLNLGVSGMNAVVGNTLMTGMIGLNIADRGLFDSMKRAIGMAMAPGGTKFAKESFEDANKLFQDVEWRKALNKYPEVARQILGIEPRFIVGDQAYFDEMIETMRRHLGTGKEKEIRNVVDQLKHRYSEAQRNRLARELKEAGVSADSTTQTITGALRKVRQTTPQGEAIYLSDELFRGELNQIVDKLKARHEKTGNYTYKLLHTLLTKPSKAYGSIDQTYRLGLAMHLTKNGITDTELTRLASRFSIRPEDFTRKGIRFTLTPEKALEITSEAYGNYLNMPGFVKIMRNMPVLGAPFFAFSYFMTANTAKTLVHNPEFINKVQFFLQEIQGDKGPLEKQALGGKYYNFLDKPGMVKLPFFKKNPVYLNMENMIPYYTLMFMSDPERSYEQKYGNQVARLLDELPILDDPIGQVLVNYGILPLALGEAQGSFGQKLWPDDANAAEKIAYAMAAAAEGVASPPALEGAAAFLPGRAPDALMPYTPFRYRQLQHALEGKTSVGVPAKEPAAQRTLRGTAGLFGLPTYYMDLKYAERRKKK